MRRRSARGCADLAGLVARDQSEALACRLRRECERSSRNVIEFRKVRNDDGPKPKLELEADVIDFRKATPATPVAPVAPTEDEPPLCLHCTVLNAIEAVVTSAVAAEVRPGEIFTSWGKGDWEKVVDPDQDIDAYSWRAGRMRYKPCKRSLDTSTLVLLAC